MAGDWMKVEVALPDKPEVWQISQALNIDPDAVVGKLIRAWIWFDTHTESGNAIGVTPEFLDRITFAPGFAGAMQSVGWLEIGGGGLVQPNFDKHTSGSAKARAETARRVAKHRRQKTDPREERKIPRPLRTKLMERDGHRCVYCHRKQGEYTPPEVERDGLLSIDHVVPVAQGGSDDEHNLVVACVPCNMFKSDRTPDECGLDWPLDETGKKRGCNKRPVTKKLPEKRREENINIGDIPAWIDDSVWQEFQQHRREIRAKLTPTATARLIANLDKHRALGADPNEALRQSIENQWRGVFPERLLEKGNGRSGKGAVRETNDERRAREADEYRRHILAN